MDEPEANAAKQDTGGPLRPPTIYDVARVAGVSHQTVSRFLKGDRGIKPANYERVLKALDELGYRPNLSARSLATRRSDRVAVLIQAIDQVGPARILQGVILEARASGYLLDIVTVDADDPASVAEAVRLVSMQQFAGIVTLTSTDEMTAALARSEFRVPVVFHTEASDEEDPIGSREHVQGLGAVVDHLVALGHRRFFCIAGPDSWVASRNREYAYREALRHHGLTSIGVAHGDWSVASGYEIATQLPAKLSITALVCENDQMAIGAIHALVERGVRVPEDVSVTGVDDIPEAAFIQPPLTTLRLAFEEQGRQAFRRLIAQLSGVTDALREPPAQLVVRSSTAAPTRF